MKKWNKSATYDVVFCALFAALMAVCSWISIPAAVPFTLQTFAVFLSVALLGGKRGTIAVVVYVLLGAVGLPVFAGFTGGVGVLLSSVGGYILGFIASALVMWAITSRFGDKRWTLLAAMIAGLFVCYLFGTAWFVVVYTRTKGAMSFWHALSLCVLPFIIPDLVKIALALAITDRVKAHVKLPA